MLNVYGHESVVKSLEEALPPVSLFRGPPSVGKETTADYIAQYHKVLAADLRKYDKLTPDVAREIKQFVLTGPFGKFKLIIIKLDHASESAMNALLKTLEEPPRTARFILISSLPILDTISSRSHVYRFGLLHQDDLFQVLTARIGMAPGVADKAAALGRGQVERALLSEQQDASRAAVLSVLKAVQDGDRELLEQAASKWDENSHKLLLHWCIEAITGRWQVFTENETFGLTRDKTMPRRILIAMRSGARPKLAVRTNLLPLLAKRR